MPFLLPPAVTPPQDVFNSGFSLLRAQQRVCASYLQAALGEYVASCWCHGIAVVPSLAALYVDLLLDQVGFAGGLLRVVHGPACLPACLPAALLSLLVALAWEPP